MATISWVVIIASGKEEMLNPETCTAFLNLQNRPILSYSLTAFEHCPDIEHVVVVAPRERLEQVGSVVQLFGCHKVKKIVPGGTTQFQSFLNGLKYVDESATQILLHEASRPFIHSADVSDLVKSMKRNGIVAAGHGLADDLVLVNKSGVVEDSVAAGSVWQIGTPLAMARDVLDKLLKAVQKKKQNPKTLWEAAQAHHLAPKMVSMKAFPRKISSYDDVRHMEMVPVST